MPRRALRTAVPPSTPRRCVVCSRGRPGFFGPSCAPRQSGSGVRPSENAAGSRRGSLRNGRTLVNRTVDVLSSLGATLARGGLAARVGTLGPRPEQPLELWEFEGCPYCRKVREALSILDLEVVVWPCPKGGPRYRGELERKAGKAQFPYLADPNTSKAMYESDDIVRYLFKTYGRGQVPWLLAAGVLGDASSTLASVLRPSVGIRYRPATPPARPLELW